VSPYAATKIAAEDLIHTYSQLYGIKAVCLRFFTVYGPRQRPDLAIHKFYRLLRHGMRVPIYGDGGSSRDYTYVADIVRGVCASLAIDCDFDVINLGGGRPVLLKDLVKAIARVLKVPPKFEHFAPCPGDVDRTCADISKAKRILGFAPETNLNSGLALFHKWYQDEFLAMHTFGNVAVSSQSEALSA
jgi:UDP-glucuronate 4-epimerase